MPEPLEYARPESRARNLALPAMICGLRSGPIAFALAVLSWRLLADSEDVGLLLLAITLGGALIFGCVARYRLGDAASMRDRIFVIVAIAAPIFWAAAIAAVIWYVIADFN